ncbi:MAG: hypothetical protein ACI37Z_02605 [Candidatus Gastranaerophilaceae bacterium]
MLKNFTARFFSCFIAVVPYNIIAIFGNYLTPLAKVNLFYTSYLLVSSILTGLNFYIARRTKRYDIAIWALFTYSFIYLPGSIWAIREIFIAFPIWFILLQYFLMRKKILFQDKIILLLTIYFCFESFELFTPLGIIIFIFSILFFRKNAPNKYTKLFTGLSSLIIAIYIVLKTIFYTTNIYSLQRSSNLWVLHIKDMLNIFFHSNDLIIIFGTILMASLIFLRGKSKKLKTILISILTVFFILFLYFKTGFTQLKLEYTNYSIMLFTLPVIFVGIISSEYFNTFKLKFSTIKILFKTALIIGILNFAWQIKGNYDYYYKYYIPMQKFFDNQKTVVVVDKLTEISPSLSNYDSDFNTTIRSLFLQSDKKHKKINTLIYLKEQSEVNGNLTYNPQDDKIYFCSFIKTDIITDDWDLTSIKNWLIEHKKFYTPKDFSPDKQI